MWGSRWATDAFMHSADWRTNGSCISPAPNRSPTTFIPARSMSLTMARAGVVCRASSRSAVSPSRSPSMMRCSSRRSTGQPLRSSFTSVADDTPSNSSSSSCSGS